MRFLAAALLALAIDCDPREADEGASVAMPTAAPSVWARGVSTAPPLDCAAEIDAHPSWRQDENRCAEDRDCAEIGPGLCPHGPYYVGRDRDLDELFAQERRIARNCKLPSCEPPKELGIARCDRGTCVAGRPPPVALAGKTCKTVRETHLEPIDGHDGTTVSGVAIGTPRIVVAPIGSSTVRVSVAWPAECGDCQLLWWRGAEAERKVLPAEANRTEDVTENGRKLRRSHYELRASVLNPLAMVPVSPKPVPYRLRAEVLDSTDHPGAVSRHGTSWDTECEVTK